VDKTGINETISFLFKDVLVNPVNNSEIGFDVMHRVSVCVVTF
jgi:hypothetical protein